MLRDVVSDLLAARFHDGDRAALAEVVMRLGPTISRGLESKYDGLLPHGEAPGIANSALAHACRRHAKYDPARGSLGGWLRAIANRFVADFLASRDMRSRRLEIATAPEELATLKDSHASDPAHGDDTPDRPEELLKLVRQALDALSANERYVLLADVGSPEGRISSSQLARELGMTASAIRTYRARGKKRLEAELRRLGVEQSLFSCNTPDVLNDREQTENGERRTENGERRTENGERRINYNRQSPVLGRVSGAMTKAKMFASGLAKVHSNRRSMADLHGRPHKFGNLAAGGRWSAKATT